ncbi:MAG TPA: hypothetical protein VH105_00705 [Burkholderiales bacterium]|jgi:hypothetical protein|nr:hypothetical protein [Burkholderiales bacterium]
MKEKNKSFIRSSYAGLALWACATPAFADHEEGFLAIGIFLVSGLLFLCVLPFLRLGWLRSLYLLIVYVLGTCAGIALDDLFFSSGTALFHVLRMDEWSATKAAVFFAVYPSLCSWICVSGWLLLQRLRKRQ